MYWIGRTFKDVASFGKAWDTWRSEVTVPNFLAGKLWPRLKSC